MQIWKEKIKRIGIVFLLCLGITGLSGCQETTSSDTIQSEAQKESKESAEDALTSAYEGGEEKQGAGQQEDYITPDDVTEQNDSTDVLSKDMEETQGQSSNQTSQSKGQNSKNDKETISKRTDNENNSNEKKGSKKQDTPKKDNRSVSNSDQLSDEDSPNNSSAEDKQAPASAKKTPGTQAAQTYCSFTIECKEVLSHKDKLKKNKQGLIPEKGIIYSNSNTVFYAGDSVFDVLLRETKNNKIQMEYNYTPAFQSNYIEGIANLYEFDCGEVSGWHYLVNGQSPNYGCNRYTVKEGDEIIWRYTCE